MEIICGEECFPSQAVNFKYTILYYGQLLNVMGKFHFAKSKSTSIITEINLELQDDIYLLVYPHTGQHPCNPK